jgi:gamma-glutamylputrescine oxidase
MSQHKLSIWEKLSYWFDRDYVIIGAGLTGLFCAIELAQKEPKASILIVDRLLIGMGASSRNAGFCCFGSISELESDVELTGLEACMETVEMRFRGLQRLRKMVGDESLEYVASGGTEVFDSYESFQYYEDRISFWNRELSALTGDKATYSAINCPSGLRFSEKMILNRQEGLINTGALLRKLESIASTLNIEVMRGLHLTHYISDALRVNLFFDEIEAPLRTKKLILCTNAYSNDLVTGEDIQPSRNQVLITTPVTNNHLSGGFHYDKGYVYFRAINDSVLIGGARNHFEFENNQSKFGENLDNLEYLMHILRSQVLVGQKFEMATSWSGILAGGKNRVPIVKNLEANVVLAARLGGMGVAIGSVVGMHAAALIRNSTL